MEDFNFFSIISVGELLAHSWELIALNDGVGLGAIDESGLEGCNKILRNVRTNITRKTSQKDNLVDTLRRMWVSSDPVVNYERYKSQPNCKVCHAVGHTIRSCQSIKATAFTEDDFLFKRVVNFVNFLSLGSQKQIFI